MCTRYNRLVEAVLTSTHNLCFEQKHKEYQNFLSENFHFLVIKFAVCLNRHVFVMRGFESNADPLRKHVYSNILKILLPKNENFQLKISDIFHISAQNIDCGYSVEPPRPVLLYKSGV